jgi:CRP/FNR family transcriptional regulator, cyclic AMP receptor protein
MMPDWHFSFGSIGRFKLSQCAGLGARTKTNKEESQFMIELAPHADQFKIDLKQLFCGTLQGCRTIKAARRFHVYTSGQRDTMINYIVSGKIKLVLPSQDGKGCLLAIRTQGEIFGELSLCGQTSRLETAVVMEEAILKQIPSQMFLTILKQDSLLEGLIQFLAVGIAEQQEIILAMATKTSEHRLAETLLHLARRLGVKGSSTVQIDSRISQSELSEMVGTTRSRVGFFLKKFRELGLVRLSGERCLVIESDKLKEYLERPTAFHQEGAICGPRQLWRPAWSTTSLSQNESRLGVTEEMRDPLINKPPGTVNRVQPQTGMPARIIATVPGCFEERLEKTATHRRADSQN